MIHVFYFFTVVNDEIYGPSGRMLDFHVSFGNQPKLILSKRGPLSFTLKERDWSRSSHVICSCPRLLTIGARP